MHGNPEKIHFLVGTRCFVLLALNYQLLVIGLETNNSKDPRTLEQAHCGLFAAKKSPVKFLGTNCLQEPLCTKLFPINSNDVQEIILLHLQ